MEDRPGRWPRARPAAAVFDRSRVGGRAAAWRPTPCEEARFARRDARAELFVMARGASRTTAPAVVSPPVTPGRFRLPGRLDPGSRSGRRRPRQGTGPMSRTGCRACRSPQSTAGRAIAPCASVGTAHRASERRRAGAAPGRQRGARLRSVFGECVKADAVDDDVSAKPRRFGVLAIATSATRLRLAVVMKWIGKASKKPPSGAPIPISITVLPGPFSSRPAANSSGLARSTCRASSRAKANFTWRSTNVERLSAAPASVRSRWRPSGVIIATAPLSSR